MQKLKPNELRTFALSLRATLLEELGAVDAVLMNISEHIPRNVRLQVHEIALEIRHDILCEDDLVSCLDGREEAEDMVETHIKVLRCLEEWNTRSLELIQKAGSQSCSEELILIAEDYESAIDELIGR